MVETDVNDSRERILEREIEELRERVYQLETQLKESQEEVRRYKRHMRSLQYAVKW